MTIQLDPAARHDVVETDELFARVDGCDLLARVYRPERAARALPGLVDVHGGAWSRFDRRVGAPHARALAARGAVVASLDFRQAPDHAYPSACADVAAGVRWMRAHAERLGVEVRALGLIGASSGGQIALEVALQPGSAQHAGTPIQLPAGTLDATSGDDSVSFVLALFPVTDPWARYRYALSRRDDPPEPDVGFHPKLLLAAQRAYFGSEENMHRASIPRILRAGEAKSLPPLWIAQPEDDANVPAELTRDLVSAYRELGGAVECALFEGEPHGFVHREGAGAERCIEAMRAFIDTQLRLL